MSLVPPRPSPIAPGYKLDRYELLCPIAEGGMASVWIARQTGKHGFQKLVAIKTILPKYAAEPKFQRMFVDEARIASRIEHANVAQILDVGEQHDVTYLVMEYVDGDSLSKVQRSADKKGEPVAQGILLRILADVCGGLHAAHELRDERGQPLGVVHRDVSPQNVLVTTRGVAKLIDFGIAKARDRLAGDTNVDQLKGKVQYMAPEQALGRPTDRRADVWAVGAVLYHLLSGKPPYRGDNDMQTLFLLTSGRPPVPLPSSVHPAVAAVVKRALTHSPEARYATAAQLQQALETAMIEAGLVTTTAAVAEYLTGLVGDRSERRKEAVALGLRAAEDRERAADAMRANADTSGGHSEPGSVVTAGGKELPASSSGQTLGSATMTVPLTDRRRSWTLAAIAAVVVLGAGATIIALSGGSSTRAPAATAAVAETSLAPTPSPPPDPAAAAVPTAAPAASEAAPSASGTPQTGPSLPPVRQPPRPVFRPSTPPPAGRPGGSPMRVRVNDGF